MGQYHFICNMDKHEYLQPHAFGDGLKLMEFGASGNGVMLATALLLAATNGPYGRGGGDWHPWVDGVNGFSVDQYSDRGVSAEPERAVLLAQHIPGRWAGDRLAIIGDYHKEGDVGHEDNPWLSLDGEWIDISKVVREALLLDFYTREEYAKTIHAYVGGGFDHNTDIAPDGEIVRL